MPPTTDLTKTSTHIYWLYFFLLALAAISAKGYFALRDTDDHLSEKINLNELRLQVQLTEIKTQLQQMNVTLADMKLDMRRSESKREAMAVEADQLERAR